VQNIFMGDLASARGTEVSQNIFFAQCINLRTRNRYERK